MKKLILGAVVFFISISFAAAAQAATISDDFNDGNADGWSAAPPRPDYSLGNWRVEDQKVVNDAPGDGYNFLLNTPLLASQTIQTKVFLYSYGGLTLWHQANDNSWVHVRMYPALGATSIWVDEFIDGAQWQSYPYAFESREQTWYTLKVIADSQTGRLDIYVDDVLVATHFVQTPYRSGLSGLHSGNARTEFDDFSVTSDAILEPLTSKNQCKKEGWKAYGFKNEGACMKSIGK
jgi:hypothetical protein